MAVAVAVAVAVVAVRHGPLCVVVVVVLVFEDHEHGGKAWTTVLGRIPPRPLVIINVTHPSRQDLAAHTFAKALMCDRRMKSYQHLFSSGHNNDAAEPLQSQSPSPSQSQFRPLSPTKTSPSTYNPPFFKLLQKSIKPIHCSTVSSCVRDLLMKEGEEEEEEEEEAAGLSAWDRTGTCTSDEPRERVTSKMDGRQNFGCAFASSICSKYLRT